MSGLDRKVMHPAAVDCQPPGSRATYPSYACPDPIPRRATPAGGVRRPRAGMSVPASWLVVAWRRDRTDGLGLDEVRFVDQVVDGRLSWRPPTCPWGSTGVPPTASALAPARSRCGRCAAGSTRAGRCGTGWPGSPPRSARSTPRQCAGSGPVQRRGFRLPARRGEGGDVCSPWTRVSRPVVNRSSRLSSQTCLPRVTSVGKRSAGRD
jgi:hypothetical protein